MRRFGEIAAMSLVLGTSAAASIVLTFFPCYATLCSEENFPSETRFHIIIYYGFLVLTMVFYIMRQYFSIVRSFCGVHLLGELPLIGKRITLGGALFFFWILAVVGAPTALWLPAQEKFWGLRADPLGWASAKLLLTITGVTGHYADILLGLLIIPVSRNSLVGHAFSLHQSSLLFAHKMISYLFSIAVITHGVSYILYATDSSSEGDAAKEEAFATGNPAMTLSESEKRSSWFTMTTYTGIAALLPILLIIITSIPWIRRRHYNFFYYCHVIFGTIIFAASCIHASTDLYFLIPGLLLWFVDLFRRFFCGETGGLSRRVPATLENADNGWMRISLPKSNKVNAVSEKQVASTQPLAYYYLNFPSISKLQNHAFTAAIPSSTENGPVFLLQRSGGKKEKALSKEWTWKLGDLVPGLMDVQNLKIRVEGPYPVNDSGFPTASHLICIVGGTGITGAYSLARWWLSAASTAPRFTLIWTVRHREMAVVREWQELEETAQSLPNMQVTAHISSEHGRLDTLQTLQQALGPSPWMDGRTEGDAWVYSSGPATLLSATEGACVKARKDIRASRRGRGTAAWAVRDISWYMARWEV
ncbi:hypothetical protein F5X68DRAFT_168680 [Plectosphaerella plurivora]|uniref:Ferric oxidoreductase domain-containing protein n=1 Tax=Plectosphaerella plurivora TaxID=936078 RepID=A0A9P8VD99_9PEZI|nr:hypothetical protein F5X68DRAFT_168680 [Plectosphaerella plurivora]